MDIGRAFSFVFEDDEWISKVLIAMGILLGGIALGILVIPAILATLLLSGYGLEITRRIIRGESRVLPKWDDWGALLADGLKVAIIAVVYALPIIAVSTCLGIPLSSISETSIAATIFGSFMGCLDFLWGIAFSFLLPVALGKFAAEGELGAAFRFGEVFTLVRDNLTTYLVLALMVWVTWVLASLGVILCLVGWLFTIPYATFVVSHLYGQAYLQASGQAQAAAAD